MFHPSYSTDIIENGKNQLDSFKRVDKGHSKIIKTVARSDGTLKQKYIDIYASGSIGTYIRDAESGQRYHHVVGSGDEDLYFKLAYATGECKNGYSSNTLFYISPHHCMGHLNIDIDQETIGQWEEKKNQRVRFNEIRKKSNQKM
jgi:hypothetical protein